MFVTIIVGSRAIVKQVGIGIGALAAVVAASLSIGAGVANAFPDVQGGLFSDAKKTLTGDGYTVVIAGRVGDRTGDDSCVVANAQQGSSLDGGGGSKGKIAVVYLNCYANVASTTGPGYSAASTEGRAALAAQAEAKEKEAAEQAAQQEATELEGVDTPQG